MKVGAWNGAALAAGDELVPGYEVVGLLDRGPYFEVYDVWSNERSCRCVAKTVRRDRRDRRHSRRLLREGRLLGRLAHPNVVRGYETITRPRPVAILETLTGETLGHVIDRCRRLAPGDVALLGMQLCSAVDYLHRATLLHLDLKPSNIVCDGGRAKVLDLSVARSPGRLPAGIGTDGYLSPEQAAGGLVGPAADVWGIGTVLFVALTGELPHPYTVPERRHGEGARAPDGGDDGEETDDVAGSPVPIEEPTPPVRSRRRVPAPLARAVDDCLSLAPAARPTVGQLAHRLGAAVGVDPKSYRS